MYTCIIKIFMIFSITNVYSWLGICTVLVLPELRDTKLLVYTCRKGPAININYRLQKSNVYGCIKFTIKA